MIAIDERIAGLEPSPTLAINERSNELMAQGKRVYKYGLGQSPFPIPASVVEVLREHAHHNDYLPVRGLPALRETVAAYHRRRLGLERSPSDILIGPGSKELMFQLMLTCDAEVLVPSPAWVTYAPQARSLGRRLRWIHTRAADGYRLRAEDLERSCAEEPGRSRVLILTYPDNPTGTTLSAAQLEELAEVARRHQVCVLSDEIYGDLHHQGAHRSIASSYPEGTIVSGGLSKWCAAGGWRLGVFSFPPELRRVLDAMAALASETYSAVSAPVQYAAVRAFEGGSDIEEYLQGQRAILSALGGELTSRLRATGVTVPSPEGAFYLFFDASPLREQLSASSLTTSPELARALLDRRGVALLPGTAFGRLPEELSIRLSYVNFDGAEALAAVTRGEPPDAAFLQRYCGETLVTMDRLCGLLVEPG